MKPRMLAGVVAFSLLAGACASRSPVDERWGHAMAANRDAQVADPTAPANVEPVIGMDPKSGEAVADRYYKGQRNQQTRQAPAIVITEP